jgi:hypothetical protein
MRSRSTRRSSPFDRGYVASPLLVDGLLYQITQGGGLTVHDANTGELVYRKVLPLKPKTEYWGWAGVSASPTLAGAAHLPDGQPGHHHRAQAGAGVPGPAQNLLEETRDGKGQEQSVSTPIFEGTPDVLPHAQLSLLHRRQVGTDPEPSP